MPKYSHSVAIEWQENEKEESYLWEFFLPSKDDIIVFKGKSLKVVEIQHFCDDNSILSYIKCKLY
jgi:hypothetical protein